VHIAFEVRSDTEYFGRLVVEDDLIGHIVVTTIVGGVLKKYPYEKHYAKRNVPYLIMIHTSLITNGRERWYVEG